MKCQSCGSVMEPVTTSSFRVNMSHSPLKFVTALTDWDGTTVLVATAALFIAYTSLGGQRAVVRTDLLQLGLMVAGIVGVALPLALASLARTGWPRELLSFPVGARFGWADAGALLVLVSLLLVFEVRPPAGLRPGLARRRLLPGRQRMVVDLLPVLDNFDRAIQATNNGTTVEGLQKGMELIDRQLHDALKKHGIEEYSCLGTQFDPRRAEGRP